MKRTILAVDDDKINMFLMTKFLSDDFNVIETHTPAEFIDALNTQPFDIILMDINLKNDVYDGSDLLNLVKKHPEHANKAVIAVTAYAMIGDKEKFIADGFDAYISKPYQKNDIIDIINNQLKARPL